MNFSDEVLIHILKYLDVRSLMRFRRSCTEYFLLGQDIPFWKFLIMRDYSKQRLKDPIDIYKMYFQEAKKNNKYGYIDCMCDDCNDLFITYTSYK